MVQKSELAGYAEQVWATCLQEAPDDDAEAGIQQRRCNPACLRERLLKQVPQARSLITSAGWDHRFTQKLLELGVVTYTVKHVRGCLSPTKSAEWKDQNCRGIEVPSRCLPVGLEF